MQLLHASDVTQERVTRTFRHGSLGPFVLFAAFATPLGLALANAARLAQLAGELPWYVWLAASPVALLVGLVYGLCLYGLGGALRASFCATNWLVKTTDEGLYLHLRSYQNRHFPDDVPTVAFLRYAEIATAGALRESYSSGYQRSTHGLGWIELVLAGVDTRELAAALEHERSRPAPEGRFLGVRGSTRSNHVPVMVPEPGVVRVERISRALLRELGRHVETRAPKHADLARADGRPLEPRLRELLARGQRMDALRLARLEGKLSLTAAHELVSALEHAPERRAA